MKNLKINDIVLITNKHSNGKKTRTVGVVRSFEEREQGIYAVLNPLPEALAKPIRDKYCTSEYNYQGVVNCYSDKYGFGCHTLTDDNTVVLGSHIIKDSYYIWSPSPGNVGYDLMC